MIYYFDQCGRITRCVQAPFHEASHLAQDGEQWIQSDVNYSDETHYITYVGADETPTLTAFPPAHRTGTCGITARASGSSRQSSVLLRAVRDMQS